MTLAVVTFLWGNKYDPLYVQRLATGVRRHLHQPHRFICLTEPGRHLELSDGVNVLPIEDPHLIGRGCFPRLRLFDPVWQRRHGLGEGAQIVCIDLDNVITGPLDPLVDRSEPLVVLTGANMSNPNPYNCSIFMLESGAHPEVWTTFSQEAAAKIPHAGFPDDQGWLHVVVPNAATWQLGPSSGIWAFGKGRGPAAWPADSRLPPGARMVAFPGWRDPSKFAYLSWVKENWRVA